MISNSDDDILFVIKSSLEKALERTVELSPSTKLRADLGVQSIDVIDFIFILEKETKVKIDLEEFFEFITAKTSGDLNEIVVSGVIDFLKSHAHKE